MCEVAEVGGVLAGLALWLPPHAHVGAWREWAGVPSLVRSVGLRHGLRVLRDYRAFDAAWPDGRFWYLGLLAVAPEAQGRGVGRALVRAGADRADRDGTGIFLETGTRANVAWYRRLGFRETRPIDLPHGPPHWALWRAPAR